MTEPSIVDRARLSQLKIAVAPSSKSKTWKNETIDWNSFCKRVSTTLKTSETIQEFLKMKKSDQEAIKDIGGFVFGHLKDGRRLAGNVLCRSALALDMDFGEPGIVDDIAMFQDWIFVAYGTHKYTPDHPRLRIIIPFSRDVTPEEYQAIGRMVAKDIGIDMFDDSSYQSNRMMYWPSTPSDVNYFYYSKEPSEGVLLNPDEVLARYDDWHDCSTWPTSSREIKVIQRSAKKQADPLTKKGIVGAFNRAYSIQDAISTFLSDVYEPCKIPGRYTYIKGESSAGLQIFEDKFAYSHHATDPAAEQLCSAFDLVRVHKFPIGEVGEDGKEIDDKKSFKLMAEFASQDPKVGELLLEEKQKQAAEIFGEVDEASDENSSKEMVSKDWIQKLTHLKSGEIEDTVQNEMLILQNDPRFHNFAYNEMADMVAVTGKVPWERKVNGYWTDYDTSGLKGILDSNYIQFSSRNHDIAFANVAMMRKFHPIRDYLNGLPEWDKVPRLDTLLVDYFGADDNEYVRAVTRKTLVAAVARVFHPGCKFDSVLVINGDQGIGKSTFYSKLAGKWFSDSLKMTDMKDKAAAEQLQGFWILELGEMAGMKKADIETVKAFITRTDDQYRPAYGKTVESHPRQCIIVGSTNSETGYLRDITGNRRFWPVKVSGKGKYSPIEMSQETVDQIWAEAMIRFKEGEKLYLSGDLAKMANEEQSEAMEVDEREGLVRTYLDTPLPDNWDQMDIAGRRMYLDDPLAGNKGKRKRTTVSNIEIWTECFGKDAATMTRSNSYEISGIMKRIQGWKSGSSKRLSIYGKQRIYRREKQEQ